MYYVLDFSNFRFYSCATTDVVEATLTGLERKGVLAQFIEIVLANDPSIRLDVDEFRSYRW